MDNKIVVTETSLDKDKLTQQDLYSSVSGHVMTAGFSVLWFFSLSADRRSL